MPPPKEFYDTYREVQKVEDGFRVVLWNGDGKDGWIEYTVPDSLDKNISMKVEGKFKSLFHGKFAPDEACNQKFYHLRNIRRWITTGFPGMAATADKITPTMATSDLLSIYFEHNMIGLSRQIVQFIYENKDLESNKQLHNAALVLETLVIPKVDTQGTWQPSFTDIEANMKAFRNAFRHINDDLKAQADIKDCISCVINLQHVCRQMTLMRTPEELGQFWNR